MCSISAKNEIAAILGMDSRTTSSAPLFRRHFGEPTIRKAYINIYLLEITHEIVSHIVEHLTVARIPKIRPISHQNTSAGLARVKLNVKLDIQKLS